MMEKEPLESYLTLFKNKLRYHIVKSLLDHGSLNSNEIVNLLKKQNMNSSKPTVFRHLIALEQDNILEHVWDLSNQSPPKATKKFKIKDDKREVINNILSCIL